MGTSQINSTLVTTVPLCRMLFGDGQKTWQPVCVEMRRMATCSHSVQSAPHRGGQGGFSWLLKMWERWRIDKGALLLSLKHCPPQSEIIKTGTNHRILDWYTVHTLSLLIIDICHVAAFSHGWSTHHRMMPLRNDTTTKTGLSRGQWHHHPLSIPSQLLLVSDHLEVTRGHSLPWVQWSHWLARTVTLQLSPGTHPLQDSTVPTS